MNQSSNHSLFSLPEQAAQNSQPLYSITLSLSCQVNFLWTLFQKLNCRTPVPFFRFFPLLFRSLDFRSRATALLLYHIHLPLSRKYVLRFFAGFCYLCTSLICINQKRPQNRSILRAFWSSLIILYIRFFFSTAIWLPSGFRLKGVISSSVLKSARICATRQNAVCFLFDWICANTTKFNKNI